MALGQDEALELALIKEQLRNCQAELVAQQARFEGAQAVQSALYMALYRSLLRASMQLDTFNAGASDLSAEMRLRQSITLVNNYLCKTHPSNMFATIFA